LQYQPGSNRCINLKIYFKPFSFAKIALSGHHFIALKFFPAMLPKKQHFASVIISKPALRKSAFFIQCFVVRWF